MVYCFRLIDWQSSRMLSYSTFLNLAILSISAAFPSGAGSCRAGEDSLGGGHLTNTITTGSLQTGDFTVAIDGEVLAAGSTFTINARQRYAIPLIGSDFRGFLMRLGETEIDTEGAFIPVGREMQVSDRCTKDSVGGVTHTSRSTKPLSPQWRNWMKALQICHLM